MRVVTCIAPVNIAVIKYWGKKDEELIIPQNDSLSGTLSMDEMHAKTTVMASPSFTEDLMWLNGKQETFNNPRLQNCIREVRRRASKAAGESDLLNWHVHICSENNFPTAAGLASSAAGYACLVFALGKLYNVSGDLSGIARQGSGSACRSLYGGFVRWHMGTTTDGSDSIAKQVVPAAYWREMRVVVLVVNDKKKKVSSTSGMQRSVQTSDLLKQRISQCVPERIVAIENAIQSKNFHKFAEITMRDSNQFHAVALDTYPPAVYMTDVSHAIVDMVHCYNKIKGENKVAYTFDAGPNACLYLLEPNVGEILSVVNHFFPGRESTNKVQGLTIPTVSAKEVIAAIEGKGMAQQEKGLLKYIISTRIGEGPQVLNSSEAHLLNQDGNPKNIA